MVLRQWPIAALALTAIVLVGALIGTSDSFEKCIKDRKSHHPYHALHEEGGLLVKMIARLELHVACGRVTTGENDGAITALATIALTFFTFALWRATTQIIAVSERQHSEMERATKVAGDAAKAADLSARAAVGVELPRFLLSSAFMSHAENLRELLRTGSPSIYIKNHGRTSAEMLFYNAYLTVRAELPEEPRYPPPIQLNLGTIVPAGGDFVIKGHNVHAGLSEESVELVMTKKSRLWLVGAISYRDFLGDSYLARFCCEGNVKEPYDWMNGRVLGSVTFLLAGPAKYNSTERIKRE